MRTRAAADRGGTRPPRHPRPHGGLTADLLPIVVPLLGMLAGLVVMLTGHWRVGLLVLGAAVLVAGLERVLLPPRLAGLLAVRSRPFDCTALLLMGVTVIAVAATLHLGGQ